MIIQLGFPALGVSGYFGMPPSPFLPANLQLLIERARHRAHYSSVAAELKHLHPEPSAHRYRDRLSFSAWQSEVTHDGLPFPLTESDTPLLREPCPHTRWSGLQIHCKREGPHEVRSAERIQRESSSLHARSSPGRGAAAGYTSAKRDSSLASALLRLYST